MCRDFTTNEPNGPYNLHLCSPPSTFTLPDYVEGIAKAYVVASPSSYRPKFCFNPRVRVFVDDEADQGEELDDDFSASSQGSFGHNY